MFLIFTFTIYEYDLPSTYGIYVGILYMSVQI